MGRGATATAEAALRPALEHRGGRPGGLGLGVVRVRRRIRRRRCGGAHHRRLVGAPVAAGVFDAEQDDRDVVAAAGFVGFLDERVADGVEQRPGSQDLGHASLRDHRGQPVAAEQQDVAGTHGIRPRVDLDVGLGSERARDDRSLGMLGGLRLGQLSVTHELVDERVVAGQALQRAVAEEVGPAVADVRDRHARLVEVGGRQRRAHAGAFTIRVRALVDLAVGFANPDGEPLLGVALVRQLVLEGLDGDLRGHLPRLRAAHAVRHHEHGGTRVGVVLVVAALAPGVGLAGGFRGAQHHVIAGRRTRCRRCGCGRRDAVAVDRSRPLRSSMCRSSIPDPL